MGYALFTARKLMLSNRVNMLNYRLMVLSQRKMTVSQQSSTLQQMFSQQSQQMSMNQQRIMMQAQFGLMSSGGTPEQKQAQMESIYNQTLQPLMLAAQQQDMVNSNMLGSVQMTENAVDLEMKTIETQLKAAQAELENIEKAEDKAIKDSAPKYA